MQATSYIAQFCMENELDKNHKASLESQLSLVVVMWSDYVCVEGINGHCVPFFTPKCGAIYFLAAWKRSLTFSQFTTFQMALT